MNESRRFLAIYLADHLAILALGEELVRRAIAGAEADRVREFLEAVQPETADDRAEVARILRGLGRRPGVLKPQLARAAAKAGRLKLNGRVLRPSPLSRLVELEGVAGVLGASHVLWRALETAGPEAHRADAGRRAARTAERLEQVEELRLAEAAFVFASGGGSR